VNVYTRYPAVRLELNGRVIGKANRSTDETLTTTFTVPFEEGELRAIGMRDGKDMESQLLSTSGPVTRLKLVPERTTIEADRGEIVYIQLLATDDHDRIVPMAELPVAVEVSGEGELLAAGSGSPTAGGSFTDPVVPLFRGRGLIIVRSSGKKGEITIHTQWEKLEAETNIQTL
jgi:beta-galactosidase